MSESKAVFIAGASGFMGRALIPRLTASGWRVTALVRPGSESKVPGECKVVVGDPLVPESYQAHVEPKGAFVQLVGVNHPGPFMGHQFRKIDLRAGLTSVKLAKDLAISHYVYLSVARPAPIMKTFLNVRAEVEKNLGESGLNATILRPWYVLGPGRMWPSILKPLYWLMQRWDSTKDAAVRLGYVSLENMTDSLVHSLEHPSQGIRILDVPAIRKGGQ